MAVAAVMLRGPPAQPPIPDGGQPETNPSALRKSDLAWLIFGLWGTLASGVPTLQRVCPPVLGDKAPSGGVGSEELGHEAQLP